MSNATDPWTNWQQQISEYLNEHGLLPTPTTEEIEIPFDVATDCWMADDDAPKLETLCRLTSAAGTVAERGAVLLFLAYLSDTEPYLRLPEPQEADRRATIQTLYSDAVSLFPVDQIGTIWHVRWEILFAASCGLWDRTTALVQQWIALTPSQEHEALTALACVNFLSVHPARTDDWVPDLWNSYEGSPYPFLGKLYASLFAAKLDDRSRLDSAKWTLPQTMTAEQFTRVLDADHAITKVNDSAGDPSPTLKLVGAWCTAVVAVRLGSVDRTREAASRYVELARDQEVSRTLLPAGDDKPLPTLAWSAAMLFRVARDLDSARDIAVFWTDIDQKSPDAWKFRAELERQAGIDAWADSYESYMRLSPDTDTSWEHSELLRLLLESRDRNAADRALRALALDHADRPVVDKMLTWDWAAYSRLHESTRERWWNGLVFVCDPRVRSAFGRLPWRYAAECFGEAVALELKARVFGPLSMTPGFQRQAMSDRERQIYGAILASKATLGTMVSALDLSRNANSHLGQVIDRFLQENNRPLREHLGTKNAVDKLRAVTDSRNDAAHDDIAPGEAKQVYAEARDFLEILVKADPRIPRP